MQYKCIKTIDAIKVTPDNAEEIKAFFREVAHTEVTVLKASDVGFFKLPGISVESVSGEFLIMSPYNDYIYKDGKYIEHMDGRLFEKNYTDRATPHKINLLHTQVCERLMDMDNIGFDDSAGVLREIKQTIESELMEVKK